MVALGSATANGQTLFAKNSDRPEHEAQPLVLHDRSTHAPESMTRCQFVELPEVRTTWRHVGSRPYWCWGYEHGFNEHQVVIGNEGLSSRIESSTPELLGMEVLRLGLERGRTAAEAVEVMTDAITRFGQGVFEGVPAAGRYDNGYLVADPHEAYVIETAGHHWAVQRVERTMGISNVYTIRAGWDRLSPGAQAYATQQGWWQADGKRFNFGDAFMHERYRSESAAPDRRKARSCAVLAQYAGKLDARTMMALLSDHSNGDVPDEAFRADIQNARACLCLHYREWNEQVSNTAASLVADLCADGSRLPVYWCSFYSPCLGLFFPVFIEGTLPPVLSVGGATPGEDSPWWLFHRLSHAATKESESGVQYVREQWAEFQNRLVKSAYQVAREARCLLDDGSDEAASRLLTDYMHENSAEMLTRLGRMLKVLERHGSERLSVSSNVTRHPSD
jgi:dipeptidase